MSDSLAVRAAGIGALAEPARRALYEYVVAQADPVGREQAALALELPVHSAKFHLDRLVAAGLLEVEFRRLSGRSGPGAGRPAKLYRRSTSEVAVSLPERHYDLAGSILAFAFDAAEKGGVPLGDAVDRAAVDAGRSAGASAAVAGDDVERLSVVLGELGYEPRADGGEVILANCPFDTLARQHPELVCGLNHSFITGVIEGLHCTGIEARLEPEPGQCCVKAGPVRSEP